MIVWAVKFFAGIEQPGKTGKREIAVGTLTFWCWGSWRVGVNEAANVPMPLSASLLEFSFIFVTALVIGAFGFDGLLKSGWWPKKKEAE